MNTEENFLKSLCPFPLCCLMKFFMKQENVVDILESAKCLMICHMMEYFHLRLFYLWWRNGMWNTEDLESPSQGGGVALIGKLSTNSTSNKSIDFKHPSIIYS